MATPTPPTRYVAKRKESDSGRRMTHERIAADLEAFRKAGGRIEVLGTTRVLTRIDQPGPAPASAPPRNRKKA
ncbi:MAG TPA: hypothetical protein VFM73_03360 [Xanthomonadaceae bacterium]|nr:hypothetical protein [Xanthomonadaceae bacterium]